MSKRIERQSPIKQVDVTPVITGNPETYSGEIQRLKELQVSLGVAHKTENDRKKEILHQRDLDHCRAVNHDRLVKSSCELRDLIIATNHIEATKVNRAYIQSKERARFNERLSNVLSAEGSCADARAYRGKEAELAEIRRLAQLALREAYEKQLTEKKHKKYLEHLALEEEKLHGEKLRREEEQKACETAQRRLLKKQQWQKVIKDFKDERARNKENQAEFSCKEEEKIALFRSQQQDRADSQKGIREQREKLADQLRNQLVEKMQAKENSARELLEMQEELLLAESEEAFIAHKQQDKEKKDLQKKEQMAEAKGLAEVKQAKIEKHQLAWNEYVKGLQLEKDRWERKELEDKHRKVEIHKDLQDDWGRMRKEQAEKIALEKEKSNEWKTKELQDVQLWRGFVDIERDKYLCSRAPDVKDYVDRYKRFSHKKDDHLIADIINQSSALNHPLKKIMPAAGTQYEVYGNMHDARLAEIYGIGSQ